MYTNTPLKNISKSFNVLVFPHWSALVYGKQRWKSDLPCTGFRANLLKRLLFRRGLRLGERADDVGWYDAWCDCKTFSASTSRILYSCARSVTPTVSHANAFAPRLYELPFGHGKPLLGSVPGIGGGLVNAVLGGWSFSTNIMRFAGWHDSPFWSGLDATNTGQFTSAVARANDYCYTSVINGGFGLCRSIRSTSRVDSEPGCHAWRTGGCGH
jgi:hypothetical protein